MKQVLHKLRMPAEIAVLIRGMHPELKRKIEAGLKAILENPHTGKILGDQLTGLRSMRISKLRIIYRVAKKEIKIIAIGPRIRIYEETYRLLQKEKRKST